MPNAALTELSGMRAELEELLYLEADLLDSRQLEDWLGLLSEDIRYRVLIARDVHSKELSHQYYDDPLAVAWMDEGKDLLKRRVAQLATGIHWAEEPASRFCHLYTNFRLLGIEEEPSEHGLSARTSCRFLIYRNRLHEEEEWLMGKRSDRLVKDEAGWKFIDRVVYLDQPVLLAKNLTTFL